MFDITAVKAPPLPADPRGNDRPLTVDRRRFQDEIDITVPIAFSSPIKGWDGGEMDIQLQRENVLDVGDSIQWLLSVISSDLDPGLYRVFVRLNATDRGAVLPPFGDLRFEVRAQSPENQPEILRRETARRLEKKRL